MTARYYPRICGGCSTVNFEISKTLRSQTCSCPRIIQSFNSSNSSQTSSIPTRWILCKNCYHEYLKSEVYKYRPTILLQLKNLIRQEIARIPVDMLERVERKFRNRLPKGRWTPPSRYFI